MFWEKGQEAALAAGMLCSSPRSLACLSYNLYMDHAATFSGQVMARVHNNKSVPRTAI